MSTPIIQWALSEHLMWRCFRMMIWTFDRIWLTVNDGVKLLLFEWMNESSDMCTPFKWMNGGNSQRMRIEMELFSFWVRLFNKCYVMLLLSWVSYIKLHVGMLPSPNVSSMNTLDQVNTVWRCLTANPKSWHLNEDVKPKAEPSWEWLRRGTLQLSWSRCKSLNYSASRQAD